jgi:hypothetical protein
VASSGRAVRRIDPGRLAARRSAAQLLHRPADVGDAADVARAICGAQAQDMAAGRLAFRARSRRLWASDVDRGRSEERSLVRTWAMRGTMHLLATEDFGWLVPLFEPGLVSFARRRLRQLGMEPHVVQRALDEIERVDRNERLVLAIAGMEVRPVRGRCSTSRSRFRRISRFPARDDDDGIVVSDRSIWQKLQCVRAAFSFR